MVTKAKTFVVTGGTVFQKVNGEMKPHKKGDKIKLAVDEDGSPLHKGIRSRVDVARKKAPLKDGEGKDDSK